MQALNHVVFGSLIALIVNEPVIAIPVALGSHFVLDTIPHYGNDPKAKRGSKAYNYRIVVDTIASILIVMYFVSYHPPNELLIMICAFVAVLPDLVWPLALTVKHEGPIWAFFKFHKTIQHESRKGIYLEIVWFMVSTYLVIYTLKH